MYIKDSLSIKEIEIMIKGYVEMSKINIIMCETGFNTDAREFFIYERNLKGCDRY